MTKREWPLNTPYKLSEEDEKYFKELTKKLERGELKFRPLNAKEKARAERMRNDPIIISTSRVSEDEFEVTMTCRGCDIKVDFDHTLPKPWSLYRDRFEFEHKDHKPKGR